MRAANFEKKPSPSHGKKKRINDIRASIGKHDPGNTRFRYTGERDGGGRNREARGRKRGGYTRGRKEKRRKREEERRQRGPSVGGTSAAIKRSDKAAMFICVDRCGERSAV